MRNGFAAGILWGTVIGLALVTLGALSGAIATFGLALTVYGMWQDRLRWLREREK